MFDFFKWISGILVLIISNRALLPCASLKSTICEWVEWIMFQSGVMPTMIMLYVDETHISTCEASTDKRGMKSNAITSMKSKSLNKASRYLPISLSSSLYRTSKYSKTEKYLTNERQNETYYGITFIIIIWNECLKQTDFSYKTLFPLIRTSLSFPFSLLPPRNLLTVN